MGTERFNALLDHLTGDSEKASGYDLEATKQKYAAALEKPRNVTKSELNMNGGDITAEMGGAIKWGTIVVKYDAVMRAELEARGVELPKEYSEMSWKEKKAVLRLDEMKRVAAEGKGRDGIKVTKITDIVPISNEMIAKMAEMNDSKK